MCRRTRLIFGCVTSRPRESTAYAYPAVPDMRSVDDLPDGAKVDVRDHRASPRVPLGNRDREVGQAVLEVDRAEVPLLRPRDEELRAAGKVRAAAGGGLCRAQTS